MPGSPIDILGSYQDPFNLEQGAGKLVNVRVVPRAPTEGKDARARFVGAPGLTAVSRPTTSPCIALCHALGVIWSAHADGSIFSGVTSFPVRQGAVAVNPSQPVVRLAEDRTALVIASNANQLGGGRIGTGYTATLAGVANAGFDTSIGFDPSTVVELDNFAIWGGASNVYANQNSKMYRSDPLAPGTVQPNSFATKEARADQLIDLAVSGRIMWPLGARSLEQWYDAGNDADFPFNAYPNSLNSVGIASRLSLAVLRDNIAFVGTDRRMWLCSGQTGQAISPPWVDLLLQQLTLTQLGQLTAYAYGQGGSDFYVLTLPGSWSLELCAATQVWCYRQSAGRPDHAGRCAVEHDGGSTYVGLDTGDICLLDFNNASEPSGIMPRMMITPWVGSETMRTTFDSIDVTSSMGPAAGEFTLDWSLDGEGAEWFAQRTFTLPQAGVQRAVARGLGTSRRRQFRFQYTGTKAPFTIDAMYANTTPGT